ncbi:hypothetical protein ACHAWC_006312 [Mediolabrus comicus]
MLSNAATTALLLIYCHAGCSTAFVITPQRGVSANSAAAVCKSQPASSSSHDVHYDVTSTCLDMVSSRRNFLDETMTTAALSITAAVATTATVATPQPAYAKETIEITPQTVTAAFDAIRSELTSPTGVVTTLSNLIDTGSFEDILQYTKESDAYFRKAKMGKAKKLLTDKDVKSNATLICNAVTFDLIGINRASRPGKENREDQLKYLDELRKDIEKFLELESTIVFE